MTRKYSGSRFASLANSGEITALARDCGASAVRKDPNQATSPRFLGPDAAEVAPGRTALDAELEIVAVLPTGHRIELDL